MASAYALAGAQWLEPGFVLPDLRDSSASVRVLAAALVAAALGAAGVGGCGSGSGAWLMRPPSQWFLAVEPIDRRCGMDRLLVWAQQSGTAASGSAAFVFRNRAGPRINLLLIDGTGVWLCVRRLHGGRFHWPRPEQASCALWREQFDWLRAGVIWMRLSAVEPPTHTF